MKPTRNGKKLKCTHECEKSLIDGEVIDTYGGDYTWRNITYTVDEEGCIQFYESIYGAKGCECRTGVPEGSTSLIEDESQIKSLLFDLPDEAFEN